MNILRTPNEVPECGSWSEDNKRGRTLAEAYISAAKASGSPCRLVSAIHGMVESQRFSGVEVGFVYALTTEIIRTADR